MISARFFGFRPFRGPSSLNQAGYGWLAQLDHGRGQNGIAAAGMRQILVEHARSGYAAKRGGGEYLLSLSEVDPPAEKRDVNLLAPDDALQRLEAFDPQKVRLVELRYFGGLTIEETAEVRTRPAAI